MKKHKARRKQRQAKQTAQPGKFDPRKYHQCMSESCRRAGKCLGRAMICGGTVHYFAVGNETEAEKLRGIREAIDITIARRERRRALGLLPPEQPHPILDDPNATEEQKHKALRAELERQLDKLGQTQLPHVLSGAILAN